MWPLLETKLMASAKIALRSTAVASHANHFNCQGCRVQGARCRVQGAGCRVQSAEFRVQDSGNHFNCRARRLSAASPVLKSVT